MRRLASKTLQDSGLGQILRKSEKGHNVRIMRVHGNLILRRVTDQTFIVGERDVRGRRTIALVVGNDFYTIILPDTNTAVKSHSAPTKRHCWGKHLRVSSAEIDTDSF